MKNKYRLKVYQWNPNGTNDIEIIDCKNEKVVITYIEALFGLNIDHNETLFVNPKFAAKFIAVSPVNDGYEVAEAFKHFFKVA
jgi:hypothetical protein